MIEIDCRKCTNLAETGDHCTLYGSDPKKACAACRRDLFMNYNPKRTPDEFKAGMVVWCVQRDTYGVPIAMDSYMYLAECQAAVIVSPNHIGEDYLEDVLIYHVEETQAENETLLCVFDACDCYPAESLAREAMEKEG